MTIIISSFERIADAKCLCICYSVCNVVRTRFVQLEIPYAPGNSMKPRPVWPPGFINFLKKLCCVQSATIHFCHCNIPSASVWWKSDSFEFIFVFAESHVHDGVPLTAGKATRRFTRGAWVFSLIHLHLCDFMLRFRYIKELLVVLPNIKHVSAEDSMKQGSIVMDEYGIAGMKSKNPWDGIGGKLGTQVWVAPKVKLPLSRCVMKNVAVIYVGSTAENLLEENEYREVAMTMMKKPADSVLA